MSPTCLYREAIRLQCFMRMRYVKNRKYPSHVALTTFTHFAQNSTRVSVLALYGSIMHVATV